MLVVNYKKLKVRSEKAKNKEEEVMNTINMLSKYAMDKQRKKGGIV